jgi:hypothetical protein
MNRIGASVPLRHHAGQWYANQHPAVADVEIGLRRCRSGHLGEATPGWWSARPDGSGGLEVVLSLQHMNAVRWTLPT